VHSRGSAGRTAALGIVGAIAGAIALGACGNQTGILLEIHKDDGVSSEVYRLRVFVGVGHDDELIAPQWWASAPLAMDDAQVTLDGEMGAGTFKLLLEPDDALPLGDDL